MNPEDKKIIDLLENTAQGIKPNSAFEAELEKRLKSAHKPKRDLFFDLRKNILPALGWAIGLSALVLILNWSAHSLLSSNPASNDTFICPVTEPNGSLPPGETVESPEYLGNGELWTILWPDGKVRMETYNKEPDGAFSMKWGWVRAVTGPLTIEGHRLDTDAPPLRADIPDGYGDTGFQVSGLIFPTTGCWEVTGRVGDASLTFVTEVVFGEATPTPEVQINTTPNPTLESTNPHQGKSFDWNGMKLYMNASMPDTPGEANVYLAQADQPATVESARALAEKFGIQGEVYLVPGELPNSTNFMVTDGAALIFVRSDHYFSYYKNYGREFIGGKNVTDAQAKSTIDAFMQAHGYDFEYRIERAPQIYGNFHVIPLLDGLSLRHDYFMPVRLEILLDDNAQIMSVYGALLSTQPVGTYGIRSAEEAFQEILNNSQNTILQGMRAGGMLNEQVWFRDYPDNQPLTLYGNLRSFAPAETGQPPLYTLNDHPLSGNTSGLEATEVNTLIEASGQFVSDNGIRSFKVDSWNRSNASMDFSPRYIHKDGVQTTVTAADGKDYPLVDAPADVPVISQDSTEQLIVSGVLVNGNFEWTVIQYFPAGGSGGGGGGGGGTGLYKLNLSGTPMPLPTPQPTIQPAIGGGNGITHIVAEGDTLAKIAADYGVTTDALMQANGLGDSNILVGQTLVIPVTFEFTPEKIEGLRGILSVTLYNQPDGTQRVEFGFSEPSHSYMLLEGSGLESLQNYQDRPVDIWGTADHINGQGVLVVKVDRFEIPFPDLNFQILKGTEESIELQGKTVLRFTSDDGKSYVQLTPNCYNTASPDSIPGGGKAGEPILLEALVVPNLTYGDYPAICVSSGVPAFTPDGQPVELLVTADQPYIMPEPESSSSSQAPSMTIEKVELVYYIHDQRYAAPNGPGYIQPMWRFYGHYSNGDEFEFLVQALKDEYLSPEIEGIQAPG